MSGAGQFPCRESVESAAALVGPHVHRTVMLTSSSLSAMASTPQTAEALATTRWKGSEPARPKIRLFFKCENLQRVGAFKARGAFCAVMRLVDRVGIDAVRESGVITHSSGNHAQALSLAARTFSIPAHIIMPSISNPLKIAATRSYGADIVFSGSTAPEREAVMQRVKESTGATFIPPYDYNDVIDGQGTVALEMEEQVKELVGADWRLSVHGKQGGVLDGIIAPCGGGGLLSGIASAESPKSTFVFGAEPSFEGGDDARRGLLSGELIKEVNTSTIADGLRTPVGEKPFAIFVSAAESNKGRGTRARPGRKVEMIFGVSEDQIREAMRLVMERMKVVVEPSAVVGLAVALWDEEFRRFVERESGEEGWDLGIVLSGGNTSIG